MRRKEFVSALATELVCRAINAIDDDLKRNKLAIELAETLHEAGFAFDEPALLRACGFGGRRCNGERFMAAVQDDERAREQQEGGEQ